MRVSGKTCGVWSVGAGLFGLAAIAQGYWAPENIETYLLILMGASYLVGVILGAVGFALGDKPRWLSIFGLALNLLLLIAFMT